jgi:hypothetical protein
MGIIMPSFYMGGKAFSIHIWLLTDRRKVFAADAR